MELNVTEKHRESAYRMITHGKGILVDAPDIAEGIAYLIAKNELLTAQVKGLEQSRVAHG